VTSVADESDWPFLRFGFACGNSAISGWQSEQYTPSVPARRSQMPPQRSQYFNSTSINSENSVCMITSAFMKK
jgi:hypothetical protein